MTENNLPALIKWYFRNRYEQGKGDWTENHDMARDLIELVVKNNKEFRKEVFDKCFKGGIIILIVLELVLMFGI